MFSRLFVGHPFSSKNYTFPFILFFAIFSLLQISHLDAGGWGKTKEIIEHEGVLWNGVYFDMSGVNFTASLPNYSGTVLHNDMATLKGKVDENSGYVIITSINQRFAPPTSAQEFVQIVQDANPDYIVHAIDSKKFGALYAVDMIPLSQDDVVWRFLSTQDALIQMGCIDNDISRQLYFFESIFIH